jgi:hypothetical protein
MQAFFRPAIYLMNRLRYQRKFMLLGATVGIVMTVLLVTVYSSLQRDITMAEQELAGLQMLKPINRMTQFMQQHRGLSSGVLNGNEAMKEKRAAKEKGSQRRTGCHGSRYLAQPCATARAGKASAQTGRQSAPRAWAGRRRTT